MCIYIYIYICYLFTSKRCQWQQRNQNMIIVLTHNTMIIKKYKRNSVPDSDMCGIVPVSDVSKGVWRNTLFLRCDRPHLKETCILLLRASMAYVVPAALARVTYEMISRCYAMVQQGCIRAWKTATCVYIYIYMYICIYTYTHTYTYIHKYTHIHT